RLDSIAKNPELGIREGAIITDNELQDYKPALIMSSITNKFYVVYERNGTLYGLISDLDSEGNIIWNDEVELFSGTEAELEFYGTFTSKGEYLTSDLMIVYEREGSIYFRKADVETGGWQALKNATEYSVKSGSDPTIVRGWADPPEIGDNDLGIYVFYIDSGKLMFTYSTNLGVSWEASTEIDKPAGGTKGNPKAFRESSYRLACVYEYNDGTKTDIYYILSQDLYGGTEYVNIASPDEIYKMAVMNLDYDLFELLNYSAPDETYKMKIIGLKEEQFSCLFIGYEGEGTEDGEVPDELYKMKISNLNAQLYTGEEP
ncbi:MAG: hypothetical protein PH343_07965, partial [Nitrospira sp.]|nr:hypothetical protein [Nitrospira sp.]